jgi:hypothetical protein
MQQLLVQTLRLSLHAAMQATSSSSSSSRGHMQQLLAVPLLLLLLLLAQVWVSMQGICMQSRYPMRPCLFERKHQHQPSSTRQSKSTGATTWSLGQSYAHLRGAQCRLFTTRQASLPLCCWNRPAPRL